MEPTDILVMAVVVICVIVAILLFSAHRQRRR